MIHQVEDVDKKFGELLKIQENGWKEVTYYQIIQYSRLCKIGKLNSPLNPEKY